MEWKWVLVYSVSIGIVVLFSILLIPTVNGKYVFIQDVSFILLVIFPTALIGGAVWFLGMVKKWTFIGSPINVGVGTAIVSIALNPAIWFLTVATFFSYFIIHSSMIILFSIIVGWFYAQELKLKSGAYDL